MPSINMIAPRRAEKKRLETNVSRLVLAIMVELAIIVSVSLLFVGQIIKTSSSISALNQQLDKITPRVNEINNFEKKSAALMPKIDTLNQAKVDTLRWCNVMNDLSVSLPSKTWLTRISTVPSQPETSDITVNLNGVSADQSLVGETMLRMHDAVRDFSTLDLHFTQNTTLGSVNAIEFEVAAGIKLPNKDTKGEVGKS